MSGALSGLVMRDPDEDPTTQDDPLAPPRTPRLPRLPRAGDPLRPERSINPMMPPRMPVMSGGADEPKLAQGPKKPLLKQEIVERFANWMSVKNLAEDLDDSERQKIADQAKREYVIDDESRSDWKGKYRDWLNFALQITAPKTYPWPNASNVIFPMITVAALQFNARAYPAIVQGRNVVKGTVIGDDRGVAAMQPAAGPGGPPPGQPPGPAPAGPGGAPEAPEAPGGSAAAALQGPPPGAPQGPPQGPASGPPPGPTNGAPPGAGGPPPQQQATGPDGRPAWQVPPGSKQARADKIGRHMSWQLLNEMPEWEEQTDRLLIVVAIVGTMFRKTYYDPAGLRNVSETVDALRLCVNYKAKSFDVAPRITEEIDVYPWEIESNIRSGLWIDDDYGTNHDVSQDEQAPVTFCEQHRRYDLDDDGYAEPLIVTFARDTGRLARITVGFDEEGVEATEDGEVQRIEPVRYYSKYGFIPNPDGGCYDVGFGHLLYPLNSAVNTTINQMFDAGHLQIAGGGFIGGGMSINTGSVRFTTGEYKVVQTQGKALRENLVPMQWPGPNPVLLQLMQFLVESAKDIGSIKDVLTGEIPGANVPGILGLAVIQQGLKVFNSIFKRIHRSLRKDYEKLFRLNRLYLPDEAGFRMGSEYFQISRGDYERSGGAEPVSDPEMVTDTQQMAQANFLLQFVQDPFFDGREIRLRALQAAAIQQIDKLIAPQAPPNAAIIGQMAQLDLEKQMVDVQRHQVDLKGQEIQFKAAKDQADLDIRRGKDKAIEIRELSTAILNLANARKADHEADQNWYALQLQNLRHQIDLLNVSTVKSPDSSPSTVAGNSPAAAGIAQGLGHAAIPGLAPPPSDPSGAAIPGGLPGQPSPGGA